MMPKIVRSLSTALVAVAMLAMAPRAGFTQSQTSGPQPSLEIAQASYNFGTVLNGPPVTHVFKLKNAGAGKLIIGQVLPSCGCTVAKPTKTELGPGETSEIDVTLSTSALNGQSGHTVTIATNDPKHQMATLTMVGNVELQVTANPMNVDFGKVAHGQGGAREVTLTALKSDGFEVGKITNSNPNLKVEREATPAQGGGVTLKVTLAGTMPVGPFVDTLDIATNRVPARIPVYGTVTGAISVDPPQVSFGIVPHLGSAERIVRITNASARPLKLTGMASSNSSVGASIEPITPGKEYKVTVLLRKNTPDGQLRGNLVIQTDDPEQQSVTIPYYGIVGKFAG